METPIIQKFHRLLINKVMTTFHINTIRQCEVLDSLLSANYSLTPFEDALLDMALDKYQRLGKGWNEEELKMHFISPILAVADPNIEGTCKTFFERPLYGIINNYELNIKTDCMVASYDEGGEPVIPYFFLQEFKQSQRFGQSDPQGQMLVAMLLAQELNANDKRNAARHLFGCYVIENNWRFTTLKGLDYCVSRQYDATQKDQLLQIVSILRKLKELILS